MALGLEMSKHNSFFSPTTVPLPVVFKRTTSPGLSLAPRDYPGPRRDQEAERPELAFIIKRRATGVNYLAGKEAPSSVLTNYLWRYNYSGYGIATPEKPLSPFTWEIGNKYRARYIGLRGNGCADYCKDLVKQI